MIFTNIGFFEERMVAFNVSVAFFTVQYHRCAIEVAYSKNQKKFLFAFVDHNIGFTCSLKGDYANGFINHKEAVEQLMNCRNHNRYDPVHFYELLNNFLPKARFAEITNQQYVRTVGKAVSDFEDRIYFNHWRSSSISERQQIKAIELMGYEVVNFCRENHLTPVFWAYPTERTLTAFADFKLDYNSHGIQQ